MRISVSLLLPLVVLLSASVCLAGGEGAAASGTSALVESAPLKMRQVSASVTGYGSVGFDPGRSINLNWPQSGRVDKLLVSVGQAVSKGQPLLQLSLDPVAAMAYEQATNGLDFARRELVRQRQLLEQQLATQSQVDAAARALKDAEATLAAQKKLGGGTVHTTLRAPYKGLVTSIAVAQGDRFQAGATLLQLAATTTLWVQLGVEPDEGRQLHPSMPAHVVSVFDRSRGVSGTLQRVAAQINPQSQLVDVAVAIPGDRLLPGSKVEVTIPVASHRAPVVPRSAVLRDASGQAYLFQNDGGRARRVGVATGVETDGVVEVSGKLLPGAPVVVLGNYELSDGMALRERQP